MTVTDFLRPAFALALLAAVTACDASSAADAPAGSAGSSASAPARHSAPPQPVTAQMPDVIGGNAGRALEQMGSTLDMTFEDASGQGRRVGDPAEWKICTSQPGPDQQITHYPVVFGVVKVSESCKDAGQG